MARNEQIFASVDIGSTKIAAIVGKKNEEGKIEVIGFGQSMSRGITRGVILNIDEAYAAISEAVRKAEDSFGDDIEQVFVNLAGQHLKTLGTKVQKYLAPGSVVSEEDVAQMYEQVGRIPIQEGYKIYQISPQLFTIDDEAGIMNPVGITGEKLEASFKVFIAPEQYGTNIQKCFDRAGIRVKKMVIDPVASSEVILSEDEKEAGVVLLDIGGGTTKMLVYLDNVLCYSSVIPFGGNVITHDIKEGCSILLRQAESLKTQFGQAMGDFAPEDRVVTIPGISGWEPKEISFKSLAFIIQARMEEIIDAFCFQLEKSGYLDKLGAGIVIAGGSSLMPNLSQLVKFRTGLDVRKGLPNMKSVMTANNLEDPRYGTVLGLLSLSINEEGGTLKATKKKKKKVSEEGFFSQVKKQVARQVTMFFDDEQDTEMY
ncbi:MAG: cell division protein FtsA [Prolixibacteraceae bacterium]|jgi:cell division protein FtsA|nr:cell division protein FtsA [Prolixibacteraceae bacterium]